MYWVIKFFIWAVALLFSVIPGIVLGCFVEFSFEKIGYWAGFILGALIFLLYLGPILSFNDDKPPEKEPYQPRARGPSLFSFLAGLWLLSKLFGKDD